METKPATSAAAISASFFIAFSSVRNARSERAHVGEAAGDRGGSGLGNRNPTLLTWLPQCPKGADAVCKKAYEGEIDVHYYNRDSAQLAAMRDNCDREGGQWVDLD